MKFEYRNYRGKPAEVDTESAVVLERVGESGCMSPVFSSITEALEWYVKTVRFSFFVEQNGDSFDVINGPTYGRYEKRMSFETKSEAEEEALLMNFNMVSGNHDDCEYVVRKKADIEAGVEIMLTECLVDEDDPESDLVVVAYPRRNPKKW